MAKKTILTLDYDYDFFLVGLVTRLKDYQLAWNFNQLFHIALRKEMGYEIIFKKKNLSIIFPWYKYVDELNKNEYHLLANKTQSEFLLPEIKQADFLFIVKGNASVELKETIILKIKSLVSIQTSVVLNPAGLKSRENLMLE